jgi:ATP-dependent helicase/nuclease subunit B
MPVILQQGTPTSQRSIEERLQGPVLEDLLVIVPTRRRIRHLVREVMREIGKPVTPAFPFHTLESFARLLYATTDQPRRSIGGPIQTLLFDQTVHRLKDDLAYFGLRGTSARLFTGTFEKIIDVVVNLKESGVSPETLEEEARNAPLDEHQKLRDIAAVYAGYEQSLERLGAIDLPGIFTFFDRQCAPAEFQRVFRTVFPKADLLSLAGFDEFAPPEIGLLMQLIDVPGLTVTLLFDYESGNPALFGHLESNYRRFRELGFLPVRDPSPRRRLFPVNTISRSPSSRIAADHIARTLFLANRPAEKADLRASVTVIEAASRRQEVSIICKLIKDLVRTRPGIDLRTVCVAMLRPQLYTDLFREEVRRFGIPANITDRYELSRAPVVIHLLDLLRLPLLNFARDQVIRVAASPYFGPWEEGVHVDAANLAEVSGELRITAGLWQWASRIDREVWREEESFGKVEDRLDRERKQRRIAALKSARRDVGVVASFLKELEQPCRPREFAARFERILERLRIRNNLVAAVQIDADDLTEREVRAYAAFMDVLAEVVELLEFQDGPEVPHTLRSYCEHIATAVLRERYNVREQFGKGVLITSIDETRGLSMDVMIVAGLVDGEFPDVYQPEVFLSAERRKERERHAVWQNRYLFYQAITNWADHLYLTYPRREGDLDLVRSSFIDALLNVVQVEDCPAGEYAPVCEGLYAPDELLRWAVEHPGLAPSGIPADLRSALGDVRHAVAVERSRAGNQELAEYSGILKKGLSATGSDRLRAVQDRSLSVTQLETYGRCPFRFFAERILQLNVPAELEEELTPLEKGSALHDALFEFYTARRTANQPSLAGCKDEIFEEAIDELTRIVESKLSAHEIPDAFWDLDRELLLGGSTRRRGLVREFLETERARQVETEPAYFEIAFGGSTGDIDKTDPLLSQRDPIVLGTLRLRGKVDRVEIGQGFFTIVDYKTGQVTPSLEEIRAGMSLQLPLYLRAMETLLASRHRTGLVPAAGLYYRLRTPVKIIPGMGLALYNRKAFTAPSNSRQIVKTSAEMQQVLDGAVSAAASYVQGMTEGMFPLTSTENVESVCAFCDYKTSCRIQSARHVTPKTMEGT